MFRIHRRQPALSALAMILGAASLCRPGRCGCPGRRRHPSVARDAGSRRHVARHARVQGRRAERRDRPEGLRCARFHPCPQRLQQQLSRRLRLRDPQGLSQYRRRGQHGRHLPRADGREVAVPDRQRRHRLLSGGGRSDQGPAGRRAAAEEPRHHQRHVVLLDHRHRIPGSRSRRRREVPAGAPGL